jgi:transketolase
MFDENDIKILGKKPILAVEAASQSVFWARHSMEFLGVETFGASAPYADVYASKGLTVENIAARALRLMGR